MPPFHPVHLIVHKRDGSALEPDAIRRLIDGYTRDEVPDYQMSAWLMAAFLQGANDTQLVLGSYSGIDGDVFNHLLYIVVTRLL